MVFLKHLRLQVTACIDKFLQITSILTMQGFMYNFSFGWGYVDGVNKCENVGGVKLKSE